MSFTDPRELYHVVKHSWSGETISEVFDSSNPCRNQCAVTALAVKKYFGGEIVKTATKGCTHFYNLIDGQYWDLAADQFDEPIPYDNVITNETEAHQHATVEQLTALIRNIDARK